ncbi:MAG: DUF975 family protein [Bacilli bacterium]
MNNSEIKKSAFSKLSGNYGNVIVAILLISILIGVTTATAVGPFIIIGPLCAGLFLMTLNIVRKQPLKVEMIFSKFSEFGRYLVWYLLSSIYTFLWSLLFLIPGFVKSYSYALAPYLMLDNPELAGQDAITKSRELMNGHKMDLFLLDLSFIGWIILSMFTFGILLLWIMPRMLVARAEFYNRLVGKVE